MPDFSSRVDAFETTLKWRKSPPLQGPPESKAVRRLGPILTGLYQPEIQTEKDAADHALLSIRPKDSEGITYQSISYLEFPNSTAVKINNPVTGEMQKWIFTRGVRSYTSRVAHDGSQRTHGYVSDVLLFQFDETVKSWVFRKRLLQSDPQSLFFFEDPRISILYSNDGPANISGNIKTRVFLSGTDYSPHVPGSNTLDLMNRFVELSYDSQGFPQVDLESGKPHLKNLSPMPKRSADGNSYVFVDAKNGTIAENELGQIVVRTRFRMESSVTNQVPGYAEQVFVFENWNDFESYDWNHALEDLGPAQADARTRPILARILLTDADLKEHFTDPRVFSEKGKGFGPGTRPIRLKRIGGELWFSDGKNAPEVRVDAIPREFLMSFPLQENEVSFLTFDHEIRYFKDVGFMKRHYSVAAKLFDETLTSLKAYYADLIQPVESYERGIDSGIVDLEHVYPMGVFAAQNENGKFVIDVIAGTSDAHTAAYRVDVLALLLEMVADSPRWKSGQIYLPGKT